MIKIKALLLLIISFQSFLVSQKEPFLPRIPTSQRPDKQQPRNYNQTSLPGINRNVTRDSYRTGTNTSLPEIYKKKEDKSEINNNSFELPKLNTADKDKFQQSRIRGIIEEVEGKDVDHESNGRARRRIAAAQEIDATNQDGQNSTSLTRRRIAEAQETDATNQDGQNSTSLTRRRIAEAQETDATNQDGQNSTSLTRRRIAEAQETDATNQDGQNSTSLTRRRIAEAQETDAGKRQVDDDGLEVIDISEQDKTNVTTLALENQLKAQEAWGLEKHPSPQRNSPEQMTGDISLLFSNPSERIDEPAPAKSLNRKNTKQEETIFKTIETPVQLPISPTRTNPEGNNLSPAPRTETTDRRDLSILLDSIAPKRRVPGETKKIEDDEKARKKSDNQAEETNLQKRKADTNKEQEDRLKTLNREKEKQEKLINLFEKEINSKKDKIVEEKNKFRESNNQKVILKDAKSIAIAISQGGERIAIPLDQNGQPYLLNDRGELFSMNVGRWQKQARDILGLKYDRKTDYEDPLNERLPISTKQYNFKGTDNSLILSDGDKSQKLEPNNILPKAEEELANHPNLQVLIKSIETSKYKLSAAKVNLEKLKQQEKQKSDS